MKPTRGDAWWAQRFDELRPNLVAYLHPRSNFDSQLATEVIGAAALQLAETFEHRPKDYPRSWFDTRSMPTDLDAAAFDGLAWTVVRRRFLDELRRRYVRAAAPRDADSSHDPEAWYTARRLLLAVAKRLEALPEADRSLLIDAAAGEGPTRSPAERQRLARLRRRLVAALAEELGGGREKHGT